jgi:hypothetical protein
MSLSLALLIVHANTMQVRQFSPYIAAHNFSEVASFSIPIDPIRINHERRYQILEKKFNSLLMRHPDGVVVFGYSIGGKFAARLAQRHQNHIPGLFLIDPVDGGAPIPVVDKLFPLFIDESKITITTPTTILRSEFGGKPGKALAACVPQGMGAQHFAKTVAPQVLTEQYISGAGHLDFLSKPYPPTFVVARAACAPGSTPSTETLQQAMQAWESFLTKLP